MRPFSYQRVASADEAIRAAASQAISALQAPAQLLAGGTTLLDLMKLDVMRRAALDGFNRMHAVLGTSEQCIATYPGDFGQALTALDATVDISGARGARSVPFAALHRLPGDAPDVETTLMPGEVITGFHVPAGA